MNYGKDKQKENEEFPKVMTKEDTKELISIVETLNRGKDPKDKIGLNLQYRQIKLPSNVYFSLKNRKNKKLNNSDKEKEDNILFIYKQNKSEEEQFNRRQLLEIENLNKKLKYLNQEEIEMSREYENITNNIISLRSKIDNLRNEKERTSHFVLEKEIELRSYTNTFEQLRNEYEMKLNEHEQLKEYEKYIEGKEEYIKDEEKVKKILCHYCHNKKRIIYYTGCKHLSLCKKCYSEHKEFEKRCPICYKISELVVKILEDNKRY